jgi:hypothetical protein
VVDQAERLLLGRGARRDPKAALALLYGAAERGSTAALLRLAALAAAGSDLRKTPVQAADFLRQAAERGSDAARAQLRLLAATDGHAPDRGWTDWASLARGVETQRWLVLPDPVAICEKPLARTLTGFLPEAVCRWLIDQARGDLRPARLARGYDGSSHAADARTNSAFQFNILNADAVIGLVRARIALALSAPLQHLEPPQILHYAVGQSFQAHFDSLQADPPDARAGPYRGDRAMTFLVYLNDGFGGGETAFPRVGLTYKGSTGDALWFCNLGPDGALDPSSLHAGLAPTSGEKWLLSQWVHDRPFAGRVK